MALIKCNECGHEVSDKASMCPNCGCPIQYVNSPNDNKTSVKPQPQTKEKTKIVKWKKPVIGTLTAILLIVGIYGLMTMSKNMSQSDIEITKELSEAVHSYNEISNFHQGLAGVCKGEMWGFINSEGKEVVPCQYERIQDFNEGLACVRKDGKWGYINKNGNVVIPFKFIAAGSFSEGLACFYLDTAEHHLGFIDKKGNVVIPAKYYGEYESEGLFSTPSFKNGICQVYSENNSVDKKLFIDSKGNVLEIKESENNNIEKPEFLVYEEDGKYGIKDSANNVIVSAKYSNIGSFSEGLADVYLYGEKTICGFVDKKGNDTFTKGDWDMLAQYEKQFEEKAQQAEEERIRQEEEARRTKTIDVYLKGYSWNYKLQTWDGNYGAKQVDYEELRTSFIKVPEGKVWIFDDYDFQDHAYGLIAPRIYSKQEYYDNERGRALTNMKGEPFYGGQIFCIKIHVACIREQTPFNFVVTFIEKNAY